MSSFSHGTLHTTFKLFAIFSTLVRMSHGFFLRISFFEYSVLVVQPLIPTLLLTLMNQVLNILFVLLEFVLAFRQNQQKVQIILIRLVLRQQYSLILLRVMYSKFGILLLLIFRVLTHLLIMIQIQQELLLIVALFILVQAIIFINYNRLLLVLLLIEMILKKQEIQKLLQEE